MIKHLETVMRSSTVHRRFVVVFSVVAASGSWSMAAPFFSGIGILPGGTQSAVRGISADGSTVVGQGSQGDFNVGIRWSASTGLRVVPPLASPNFQGSLARQVSADGSVIVGISEGRAFRWTNTGGLDGTTTDLGTLQPSNEGFSNAWGVSDDGDTVIGTAQNTTQFNVFRWTPATGMVSQGLFDGQALSPDGGWFAAQSSNLSGPFLSDGASTFLVDAIAGVNNPRRIAGAVSRFGGHVAGTGDVVTITGFQFTQAFLFSRATGVTSALPDLPGGLGSSAALDLSDDASRVVGWGSSPSGRTATIWINGVPQSVSSFLAGNGVTGLAGWRLTSATAISPDGLSIAGDGLNPQGRVEGWIARVPGPGAGALWMLGGGAIVMRRRQAK